VVARDDAAPRFAPQQQMKDAAAIIEGAVAKGKFIAA
jgi:hypothetical protein